MSVQVQLPPTTSKNNKNALLIGVGNYQPPISSISVCSNDIARVKQALANSGYSQIDILTTDPNARQPTRNAIREAVHTILEQADPDSTVFLYFSGHGVNVNGIDYLCPSDTPAKFRPGVEQDLVAADLGSLAGESLQKCRAQTIFFVIDACRDYSSSTKGFDSPLAKKGSISEDTRKRVYTLYACRAGEAAHFDEALGGSIFTIALAAALQPDSDPRTIDEVAGFVEDYIADLCAQAGLQLQTPSLRLEADHSDKGNRVICAGRGDDRNWEAILEQFRSYTTPPTASIDLELLDDLLRKFQKHLPLGQSTQDVWLDSQQTWRWMNGLNLVSESTGLTAQERALTALVILLCDLALRVTPSAAPDDPDDSIIALARQVHTYEVRAPQVGSDLSRRAAYLTNRRRTSDAQIIKNWLTHQAERRAARVWSTTLIQDLAQDIASIFEVRPTRQSDMQQTIVALAASTLAGVVEPSLPLDFISWSGNSNTLRIRKCFATGHLTYLMSIDLRTFGEPLAHEVGLRSNLDIWVARQQLAELVWSIQEDVLLLIPDIRCSHAASDRCARNVVQSIRAFIIANQAFLPAYSVSESRILPLNTRGVAAYIPPVPQITLDTNAVRKLLVGRELYGSPLVVVRELFQNALDACRYRFMRERYLAMRNPLASSQYVGRIEMSVYKQEDGQLVLDCRDNGVGMGPEEVQGAFTTAGRRFTDLPSFQQEQDRWQEQDSQLILYPNSRFGIGVFSYFLLAEEVEVYSTRQQANGKVLPDSLHLHLSSASGLVTQRKLREGEPAAISGGTLVRLFLNETEWLGLDASLEQIVEETLGYAEFDLLVSDGISTRSWEAGSFIGSSPQNVPVFLGDGTQAWWIDGSADLLADGVRQNVKTHGYMVNLGGPRRPRLSVSRNEVEGWDREWVEGRLAEEVAELDLGALISMEWLWSLTTQSPHLADSIYKALSSTIVADIPLTSMAKTPKVPLRKFGVAQIDGVILLLWHRKKLEVDFGEDWRALYESQINLSQFDPPTAMWRDNLWRAYFEGDRVDSRRVKTLDDFMVPHYSPSPIVESPSTQISAPSPLEGTILSSIGDFNSGLTAGFISETQLTFCDIVQLAAKVRVTIKQVIKVIIKYRIVGVVLTDAGGDWTASDFNFVPTPLDALVSQVGLKHKEWWPRPLAMSRAPMRWLCRALADRSRPTVDELIAAAIRLGLTHLADWLRTSPPPPTEVIRRTRTGERGAMPSFSSRHGSMKPSMSVEKDMEAWLTSLGYPPDEELARIEDLSERLEAVSRASRSDLIIWSVDKDGQAPWISGEINLWDLLSLAAHHEITLNEARQVLSGLPGVVVPACPSEVADLTVPQAIRTLAVEFRGGVNAARSSPSQATFFIAFLRLLAEDEDAGLQHHADLSISPWSKILGWPALSNNFPPISNRVLRAMGAFSVLDPPEQWPSCLGVLATFEWCHWAGVSDSDAADEILRDLAPFGVVSALQVAELGLSSEAWIRASAIARLLRRRWPLALALAFTVERCELSLEQLIDENLPWLDRLSDDARTLREDLTSVPLPGDWAVGDDWLAQYCAPSDIPALTKRTQILALASAAGVSVGRVDAATQRLGLPAFPKMRCAASFIPDANDVSISRLMESYKNGSELLASVVKFLDVDPEEISDRVSRLEFEDV
jgi:hypothetical protein